MSEPWKADPFERATIISTSPILKLFREIASNHHLAMRRRYDYGSRLVWDIGEYSRPGAYGTIELNSIGYLRKADLFGQLIFGPDLQNMDPNAFVQNMVHRARQTPVTIVPQDTLLQSSPSSTLTIEPQLESHKVVLNPFTGEMSIITRVTKPTEVVVTGAELPTPEVDGPFTQMVKMQNEGKPLKRFSWTLFWLLTFTMASSGGSCIYLFRLGLYTASIISGAIALACLIVIFAVAGYYEDERFDAESRSVAHRAHENQ